MEWRGGDDDEKNLPQATKHRMSNVCVAVSRQGSTGEVCGAERSTPGLGRLSNPIELLRMNLYSGFADDSARIMRIPRGETRPCAEFKYSRNDVALKLMSPARRGFGKGDRVHFDRQRIQNDEERVGGNARGCGVGASAKDRMCVSDE